MNSIFFQNKSCSVLPNAIKKTTQSFSGIFLFLLFFFICLSVSAIDGNGKVQKQERTVTAFNAIEVNGAFDIYLSQGEKESLIVETDENLQEYIVSNVSENKLKVYVKKGLGKSKVRNLYITMKDIRQIDVSGATDLKTTTLLTCKVLSISASGATDLKMKLLAEKINISISGSGDAEITGSSKALNVDISGAGSLKAASLECEAAVIVINGAGDARVNVQKSLNVDVSGAGSVSYKGSPAVKKNISGAGSVKQIK